MPKVPTSEKWFISNLESKFNFEDWCNNVKRKQRKTKEISLLKNETAKSLPMLKH